jgi:hypothetical protein
VAGYVADGDPRVGNPRKMHDEVKIYGFHIAIFGPP